MKVTCATCKYEYDTEQSAKCPRCGTVVPVKSGCENCSGCSFWKSCKVK